MTPLDAAAGTLAPVDAALKLARHAEAQGFAALWTRDVPLMIPQGLPAEGIPVQAAALDDPFVWLTLLATATQRIALGTAAIVLPLRHPLHVAKAALSVDRISGGRLLLGLGSGDRPEESTAFGAELDQRAEVFRRHWPALRAALAPAVDPLRASHLEAVGHPVLPPPDHRIPMLVVGSARQSLQWIAQHADGWATYHRDTGQQQGRIGLWQQAQHQRLGSVQLPFVQSAQLDLLEDDHAPAEPLPLGLRGGSRAVLAYLQQLHMMGAGHVILNLSGPRPAMDVLTQLGRSVIHPLR